MRNHTTGPWTENACEVQAPDGSPICEMLARPEDTDKWVTTSGGVADANSRLICAAPELLALAERLVETAKVCRDCEWDVQSHELIQLLTGLEREAKEAINKAQGGAK